MANHTILGESTSLRGRIHGDGDLEIAGHVEGEVEVTGEVLVHATAALKANLRAQRIVVRGSIAGDLIAVQAIHLEAGARVVGSLYAPTIAIGEGALIRGRVETVPGQRAFQPAPAETQGSRSEPRREPRREPHILEPTRTQPTEPRRREPSTMEVPRGEDPRRRESSAMEVPRTTAPLPPMRPAIPAVPQRSPAPVKPEAPPLPAIAPSRPLPPPPAPSAPFVAPSEAFDAGEEEDDDQPPPPLVPALKRGIRGAMKQRQR